ncbi:MAG: porin family protein [Weeksellaceae bacterium]|nr:porin family protein [Weeksellaceae bacterium]
MKNFFLTAVVAVMGMSAAFGQVRMENVDIGVRAGYNHASFSGTVPAGFDLGSQAGFHAGLFAEIPVSPRFSIQPEALYFTQGGSLSGAMDGVSGDATIKSQYFAIPVLAKVYVIDGLNVQVGPQIGILMGANSELNTSAAATVVNDDFHKDMNSFDFGGVVGLGYKFPQGFSIDARYHHGFSEVMKETNSLGQFVDNDFKNRVFSVGVGYQF